MTEWSEVARAAAGVEIDCLRAERDVRQAIVDSAWRELRASGATYREGRTLAGAISDALDTEREAVSALRTTLTATEKDAAYWRAECRAAEVARDGSRIDAETAERERDEMRRALIERDRVLYSVELALGEACTGDLARDVTGLVATLHEHEIALARATPLLNACDTLTALDCTLHVETRDGDHAWCRDDDETFASALVSMTPEVVAVTRKAAEPAPQPERLQLCTPEAPKAALAVGDPVHVRLDDRAAVGRIGRSPTDGTLEAWRVEADDGQEVYAREADIERVAVEGER